METNQSLSNAKEPIARFRAAPQLSDLQAGNGSVPHREGSVAKDVHMEQNRLRSPSQPHLATVDAELIWNEKTSIDSKPIFPTPGHEPKTSEKRIGKLNGKLSHRRLSANIPPQLRQVLASIRASSFAFNFEIVEAHLSWTIEELLQTLETESFVLVRRSCAEGTEVTESLSEVILSRMALLQVAMETDSLEAPLSTIVDRVAVVEVVHGNETLDQAFATMLSSGCEEVSVVDQGVIRGVITAKCLLAFIRHQLHSTKPNLISISRTLSLQSSFGKMTLPENVGRQTGSIEGLSWESNGPASRSKTDIDDDSEDIKVHNKKDGRASRCVHDHFTDHQMAAQTFCTSWCCELLIALCVTLDVSIGISDIITNDDSGPESLSLIAMCCICAIFVYERAMRAYGFWLELLYHPVWVFDCVVVDVSALVAILVLSGVLSTASRTTVTMVRVLRMIRIVLIIRNLNVTRRLRQVVSWQKTRYKQDGFDLDLTYVNNTCIAMSLPALGAEVHYRNPINEVQRFFRTKHPDHYLIFNLCKERNYDHKLFDGRVVKIDVEDHNPPRLSQIITFLERADQFMEEDPLNCIAVHCKGGKGRTGIMICAWLMYTQFSQSATEAMKYFEQARTGTKAKASQGVSQPSQQRYVRYVEEVLACGGYYAPSLTLRRIVIRTCPRVDDDGGCNPWFTIEENERLVYDYRTHEQAYAQMHPKDEHISFDLHLRLEGDVRVVFYDHDDAYDADELCGLRRRHYIAADDLCFFFWFHTGFVPAEGVTLPKEDVDVACHDHACKVFQPGFAVELHFDRGAPAPPGGGGPDRGPLRRIIRPSAELVERSRAMRLLDHAQRVRSLRSASRPSLPDVGASAIFQESRQSGRLSDGSLAAAHSPRSPRAAAPGAASAAQLQLAPPPTLDGDGKA